MATVYLVRLGETENNRNGVWSGRKTDSPLTRDGERQALHAAELLAAKPITAIYASPAKRVLDSASFLADQVGLPVTAVPEFQEIDLGEFDGMSVAIAKTTDLGRLFLADPTDTRLPSAQETLEATQEKALSALDSLLAGCPSPTVAQEQAVVVYTHGATMRLMLLGMLGMGPGLSAFWRFQIGNSAMARLAQQANSMFVLEDLLNFGGLALPMPARVANRSELPPIRLRAPRPEDWDDYRRWRLDPDISGPLFGTVTEAGLQKERVRFEGGRPDEVFFAIEVETQTGSFTHVGDVRVRREEDSYPGASLTRSKGPAFTTHGVWSFGLHIDKAYWGHGYGTSATVAMLDVVFRLMGAARVSDTNWSKNTRARRCLEKAGFYYEGLHHNRWWKNGEWRDEVVHAILKDDYQRLWGESGFHWDTGGLVDWFLPWDM